jgi:hypothetical protein
MKTVRRQQMAEEGPTAKTHRESSRVAECGKISIVGCLDHAPRKFLPEVAAEAKIGILVNRGWGRGDEKLQNCNC